MNSSSTVLDQFDDPIDISLTLISFCRVVVAPCMIGEKKAKDTRRIRSRVIIDKKVDCSISIVQ